MGIFDRLTDRDDRGGAREEMQYDTQDVSPEWAAERLRGGQAIGQKEIARATEILTRYKQGKSNLEERIVQDELWWELRHWDAIRRGSKSGQEVKAEPASAWLFNAILNKHADAMDNYPEPVVLPRERSDEQSAKILSEILPVILEHNEFEDTYNDNWWEKLKHGTGAYGIFWNPEKENGLGDIDIKSIDLLKIFWEPGITDIQKSRNLFIVDLVDDDILEAQYPHLKGKLGGRTVDVKEYIYDDTVDVSNKSVVVDWYYKVRNASGKTVLHYVKFVGDTLLFASENEPEYAETGWYEHGLYPVVLDVMFPEKGTPVGFGYVAICKDPQLYIDKLSANILESSMMATKRRFFVTNSTGINEEEFLDWNNPIVHVEGNDLSESRIREISLDPISGHYINMMQLKIDELKETAANRDVNNGGSGNGITAASAIAALQEAGNKVSRDMLSASYRASVKIASMCIELIRQFYDETRSFRIVGGNNEYQFVDYDNSGIKDQVIGLDSSGMEMYRRPVFDLKIKAQKKNPFSRMEQNERAKELYSMGFFAPEKAQEALGALEMMDFEGIDKVKEQAREGQTLLNMVQQMSAQMQQMSAVISGLSGAAPIASEAARGQEQKTEKRESRERTSSGGNKAIDSTMQTLKPYAQKLAARSTPNMNSTNNGATPMV